MKRFLVLLVLITIFAVAFASLSRTTTKKQVKEPIKTEKKCKYRSSCSSYT